MWCCWWCCSEFVTMCCATSVTVRFVFDGATTSCKVVILCIEARSPSIQMHSKHFSVEFILKMLIKAAYGLQK